MICKLAISEISSPISLLFTYLKECNSGTKQKAPNSRAINYSSFLITNAMSIVNGKLLGKVLKRLFCYRNCLLIYLFLRLNFYFPNIFQTAMELWESQGVGNLVVLYSYSPHPQTRALFHKGSEHPLLFSNNCWNWTMIYPVINICLSS